MNKIAIVSCYFQKNYGSMLQAYATQLFFDQHGIYNETICIDGFKKDIKKSKLRYFLRRIGSIEVLGDKAGYAGLIIRKNTNSALKRQLKVRSDMFDAFVQTHFHLSEAATREGLPQMAGKYEAVIVGSDQLWLPSNIYADFYTLNFVPEGIKKLSYATSFGVSSLPQWQLEAAKHFLNRMDHISVRENTGRDIIKRLTGRDAVVVCDPTLLFDAGQWEKIQKPGPEVSERYIFCYFLGNNPEQRAFAMRLRQATGYKIIALLHLDQYIKSDNQFADMAPFDIGPAEFLTLISHAEFICTDSFHCSVFSILYRKNFCCFKRFKKASAVSTNSRIHSLFQRLGLQDRLLTGEEDVFEYIGKEIDYAGVHEKLKAFRAESVQFLQEALHLRQE